MWAEFLPSALLPRCTNAIHCERGRRSHQQIHSVNPNEIDYVSPYTYLLGPFIRPYFDGQTELSRSSGHQAGLVEQALCTSLRRLFDSWQYGTARSGAGSSAGAEESR